MSLSWLEEIQGVVSDVSGLISDGVDTWDKIVGTTKTDEQPGTVQANPPGQVAEAADANPTFVAGLGLDNTQLLLLAGAGVLLFVLLR